MPNSRALSGVVLLAWLGLAAASSAFPMVGAALNADNSAVVVTGSNTSDQNYQCVVTGRISVAAERAFLPLQCNFRLPANTPDKQLCQQDGTGPASLTAVNGVRFTCAPR